MAESKSLDARGKPKRGSILSHSFSFLFSIGDISKRKTNTRWVKGFLCWDSCLFEPRMRNPVLLGRSRSQARRVERERSSESPRTYAHESVSRGFQRSGQISPETCACARVRAPLKFELWGTRTSLPSGSFSLVWSHWIITSSQSTSRKEQMSQV